jgi:electron transfer flavoprotein-quinone oxidoreductase
MRLEEYRGMIDERKRSRLLLNRMPRAVNEAAYNMFLVDGVSKAEKQKQAVKLIKDAAGGTLNLMKLGYKGWRSMNG